MVSKFNEAAFREKLLPSSGNVNDYVTDVYSKFAGLNGDKRTCGTGWEEIAQCDC